KACWGPDPVSFQGRFYRLPPFGLDPKPAQGARLPVLGGGESDAALRRVAEVCDGWHPLNLLPEQVAERLGRLREWAARAGRSVSDFFLTASPGVSHPLTAGLVVEAIPSGIPEERRPGETPDEHVRRLAAAKARAVAASHPGRFFIGADTVVVLGGEVLGKPRDAADAERMLRELSGEVHDVVTGYAVYDASVDRID